MSSFDDLIADLTREVERVQPKDTLLFCANWFQVRLEEQRARIQDSFGSNPRAFSIRRDLTQDPFQSQLGGSEDDSEPSTVSPLSQAIPRRPSQLRNSIPSPFGTLNVSGNALLGQNTTNTGSSFPAAPTMSGSTDITPATNHDLFNSNPNPFGTYEGFNANPNTDPASSGDYLHPPSSAIFARRTSVSAETIAVDSGHDEPLPVHTKSAEQLRRIKGSIANNFIFRDLDEEQESGVLGAMQEIRTHKGEVIIRQGDVGEYFYVVEEGLLHCYIHPEPLPPSWTNSDSQTIAPSSSDITPDKFTTPGVHPVFGKEVAVCKPGTSFGELALMYGHPRAATVVSTEASTLWSLDRITFRTIILKAAHRRRTMYEQFLAKVDLLSSLQAEERSKIADALVSTVYNDGEAVVRQGEPGDTFYFVEEGEANVTKTNEAGDGIEIPIKTYKKGDYFGELSLLRLAPRAATVSAANRTDPNAPRLKVAGLDAASFTRLLGPLKEIMERRAGERYGAVRR